MVLIICDARASPAHGFLVVSRFVCVRVAVATNHQISSWEYLEVEVDVADLQELIVGQVSFLFQKSIG